MQLVDLDDDDVKVGRGGGSKGGFGGGRREKLADVVFRQALRKFDQKVLLATPNFLWQQTKTSVFTSQRGHPRATPCNDLIIYFSNSLHGIFCKIFLHFSPM